ncbi:amidinotransferase [Candidatus Saccharibacteria bacterium]|nr:amidinotransferase [Candidatus Saccharibacteria bacterium]
MPLINTSVLMSDADNFSTLQAINPYYHHEPLDLDKAIREHASIYNLLKQAGIAVTKVPSPIDCQDGVYTANWALVRGDTAVLARLPNARQAEEAYAEKVLTDLGKTVIRVPDGLKFSGQGDALACGNYLFCGSGYRSDEAAQAFAAKTLGYERVQLQAIPQRDDAGRAVINASSGWADSYFYDIDLALAIIKAPSQNTKGLIAYCPAAFMPASRAFLAAFDGVDKIEVSLTEAQTAFATNMVSTGETVIMSALAPELASALRAHGLTIVSPTITELAKGGGYIRCITLTLT